MRAQESQDTGDIHGHHHRFTCSDPADCDCEWEASGKDEEDILAAVERHGMEVHNRRALTEQERNKIRAAIRGNTAA